MGDNLKKRAIVKYMPHCKKVFTFFISNFGLFVMVTVYLVVGASIFEQLEKDNEVKECFDSFKDYHNMETMTLASLKDVIYSLHPESYWSMKRVLSVLEMFGKNTMDIKYDGRDCARYGQPDGPQYKWSWQGSLLFAVTVVSTIGYGHIAPKTVWGRMVCLAYAIIGIPLTMIFLAKVGNTLANMLRFMYYHSIHCGKKKKKLNITKTLHIQLNNAIPERISQRDIISSVQIVEQTGSLYSRIKTRRHDGAYKKTSMDTRLASENAREHRVIDPVSNLNVALQPKGNANVYPQGTTIMTQGDMKQRNKILQEEQLPLADDNENYEEELNVGVPVTVTILIIISYIFCGAYLFSVWRDWDMLQATYFCFISLSTIGFGDLVPGTEFNLPSAQAELAFGTVYIMFGLALISMGFALMQEEFLEKTAWIGRKLGVVSDQEE